MSKIGAYVLETCADKEDWSEPDYPDEWTQPKQGEREQTETDQLTDDIF